MRRDEKIDTFAFLEMRRDEKNDGKIEWFRNETRKVIKRDEKNDGTIEWFRNETR
jgi:hypothetical protein